VTLGGTMADAAPIDYDDTPNPIPYGGGPKTTKKKAENRMTSMKAPKSSGGEKFSDGSKAAEVTEGPGRAEPEPDELSSGLEAVSLGTKKAVADRGEEEEEEEEEEDAVTTLVDNEHVILDIMVLHSTDGYVECPPGYFKIPYDVNKGSGGGYIYIAYQKVKRGEEGKDTPITDLCVITGKNKSIQAPVGYTKIEGDLNKGTGGMFVFLCYHRGQLADPISDLYVMGGKTSEVLDPPPGYAKIDADLNAGALLGEKIILCVRRARPPENPRPALVITDLYIIYDSTGEIQPPPGFYKIPYDLNKGTSGKYIYLCYRLGYLDGAEEAVNDIVVCSDARRDNTMAPSEEYTRLETDLNKGSMGHYVYLCYKKGEDELPITDLFVMGGRKTENLQPPEGFEQLPLDLNMQNWGNIMSYYVYLCYKRHDPDSVA